MVMILSLLLIESLNTTQIQIVPVVIKFDPSAPPPFSFISPALFPHEVVDLLAEFRHENNGQKPSHRSFVWSRKTTETAWVAIESDKDQEIHLNGGFDERL